MCLLDSENEVRFLYNKFDAIYLIKDILKFDINFFRLLILF